MSEELAVDTDTNADRMQETIQARREEADAVGQRRSERPRWLEYLALTTALFAVLAAFAALEAGSAANEALFQANRAVLEQTRAVDAWSEFQADSVKKYEARSLATLLAHVNGTPAEIQAANDEATKRQARQDTLQVEAKQRDAETAARSNEASGQLEHHHRFALTVTLFQVAIGLSAIAALLRQRLLWWVSLVAGGGAVLALIDGFLLLV